MVSVHPPKVGQTGEPSVCLSVRAVAVRADGGSVFEFEEDLNARHRAFNAS